MNTIYTHKEQGFTLLEIILSLAILSTLVYGIASFVNLISVARVKTQTMNEVDQQALHIIESVTHTISAAQTITTPLIGETQNTLVLIDKDSSSVIFSNVSGAVLIDRGAGAVPLSSDRVSLSNLSFRNLSRTGTPPIIQMSFTISYNALSTDQMYVYSRSYTAAASLAK